MTDHQGLGDLPLDFVIARRALACLIVAVVVASITIAILRGPAEFVAARAVWRAFRNWALP